VTLIIIFIVLFFAATSSHGDYESAEASLAAERQQNNALKTKMETLNFQLAAKQRDLAEAQNQQAHTILDSKKLQEITFLKATVRILQ